MRRRVLTLAALAALAPLLLTTNPATAAVPLCFGKPATIVGTAGPDTLIGQSGVADVIYGGGGDDYILGGEFYMDDAVPGRAPDLLCGGPGNDTIRGGPGDDRIKGGDGNDLVDGRSGSDIVQGNAGNDRVLDQSFADADAGNDILRGGNGDDHITTAWGIDKAYGEGGNDTLIDWECTKSYLYGGAGDDTLASYWSSYGGGHCDEVGTSTVDVVHGNAGNDRAEVSSTDSVTGVEVVTRIAP